MPPHILAAVGCWVVCDDPHCDYFFFSLVTLGKCRRMCHPYAIGFCHSIHSQRLGSCGLQPLWLVSECFCCTDSAKCTQLQKWDAPRRALGNYHPVVGSVAIFGRRQEHTVFRCFWRCRTNIHSKALRMIHAGGFGPPKTGRWFLICLRRSVSSQVLDRCFARIIRIFLRQRCG